MLIIIATCKNEVTERIMGLKLNNLIKYKVKYIRDKVMTIVENKMTRNCFLTSIKNTFLRAMAEYTNENNKKSMASADGA